MSLLFVALHGEPEYDIILLAPENHEFTTENYIEDKRLMNEPYDYFENKIVFNDTGHVGGILKTIGEKTNRNLYIYHKDLGFRFISLPNKGVWGRLEAVNKKGIAVGVYDKTDPTQYSYCRRSPMIFVYDTQTEECYDLLEAFGYVEREEKEGFLLDSCVSYGKLILHITDDNNVIVGYAEQYKKISQSFIFNLQEKTIFSPDLGHIIQVNDKGQMIGAKTRIHSHFDSSVTDPWFYDLETGKHDLGSLDQFGEKDVVPYLLSSNGIVAGFGYNSNNERKGFTWSKKQKLQEFDILDDNFKMKAINDRGHIVGGKESAFLWTPEDGYLKLVSNFGNECEAEDINNQTQVVGTMKLNKKNFAVIWDSTHGMRNLAKLIPQDSGWETLIKAYKINNSGCIVGMGKYCGITHNFLLIPRNQDRPN